METIAGRSPAADRPPAGVRATHDRAAASSRQHHWLQRVPESSRRIGLGLTSGSVPYDAVLVEGLAREADNEDGSADGGRRPGRFVPPMERGRAAGTLDAVREHERAVVIDPTLQLRGRPALLPPWSKAAKQRYVQGGAPPPGHDDAGDDVDGPIARGGAVYGGELSSSSSGALGRFAPASFNNKGSVRYWSSHKHSSFRWQRDPAYADAAAAAPAPREEPAAGGAGSAGGFDGTGTAAEDVWQWRGDGAAEGGEADDHEPHSAPGGGPARSGEAGGRAVAGEGTHGRGGRSRQVEEEDEAAIARAEGWPWRRGARTRRDFGSHLEGAGGLVTTDPGAYHVDGVMASTMSQIGTRGGKRHFHVFEAPEGGGGGRPPRAAEAGDGEGRGDDDGRARAAPEWPEAAAEPGWDEPWQRGRGADKPAGAGRAEPSFHSPIALPAEEGRHVARPDGRGSGPAEDRSADGRGSGGSGPAEDLSGASSARHGPAGAPAGQPAWSSVRFAASRNLGGSLRGAAAIVDPEAWASARDDSGQAVLWPADALGTGPERRHFATQGSTGHARPAEPAWRSDVGPWPGASDEARAEPHCTTGSGPSLSASLRLTDASLRGAVRSAYLEAAEEADRERRAWAADAARAMSVRKERARAAREAQQHAAAHDRAKRRAADAEARRPGRTGMETTPSAMPPRVSREVFRRRLDEHTAESARRRAGEARREREDALAASRVAEEAGAAREAAERRDEEDLRSRLLQGLREGEGARRRAAEAQAAEGRRAAEEARARAEASRAAERSAVAVARARRRALEAELRAQAATRQRSLAAQAAGRALLVA